MKDVSIKLPEPVRPDFVPADAYVYPSYVQLEEEKLWPKTWLLAAREEEMPRPGDFVTFDIGKESILLVRQADKSIKAFYNVCQHRGRRLKDTHCGRTGKILRCNFHGWRYNIDGSLESILNREDWDGCETFSDDQVNLKEVKLDTWAGWVWVSMDPDIEPLDEYLKPVKELLDPFEMEKQRFRSYTSIVVPCNWKVVVDAFNEAYHSAATHPSVFKHGWPGSTTKGLGKHGAFYQPNEPAVDKSEKVLPNVVEASVKERIQYKTQRLWDYAGSMITPMLLEATKRLDELPEDADDMAVLIKLGEAHKEELAKKGIEWPAGLTPEFFMSHAPTDIHIFPNTTLVPGADATLWHRMRPNGDDPASCLWDFWSLERFAEGEAPEVARDFYPSPKEFEGKNPFLEEDFGNMEATQKGMLSRGFHGGRTNPVQEASVSNFHRVLYEYYSAPDEA
ncbi:aromatic ring-hydroxylating oxygenase subunit alpha [Sphingomonas crocodyli]|uniref:Aromatic ring-hydroxylating dioxygenase subunit alpha n=1 Tax=Sphingomonas crocodyli TaxID=1979270 RepID=A0A437LVA8_9SPHN|nr:aromatic ring-hydroxylating dioxygenase subunit alpha [Sphingomonas crocodyli]RVT89308.1 aromatic ring-hydroxylating dioxygenase subunit alpha [Sphingomonas crocodyli]